MSTETAPTLSPQEAAKANWDALTSDTTPITTVEPKVEETPAAAQVEIKPEDIAPETPSATESKTEETTETPAETDLGLTLSVEDITDAPKVYTEGTPQWIANELGIKLEKDDVAELKKAFTENFVPVDKFNEVKAATTESLYAQLDPKTATAFKLIDMGIDPSMAFNPTAQHDYLLSMDNAQLLRAKLEANPAYDEDMVNAQMEQWEADGKIDTLAKIEKASLDQERQTILNKQSELVNQFTEQKKQEAATLKQQADQKFLEVLDKATDFIGLPLSKEVKDVIAAKYKQGGYDNVLNDAQNKLTAVLHHQFGKKFQETALSKAKEAGKAEIVRKLSDVPLNKGGGGGREIATTQADDKENPWAALM